MIVILCIVVAVLLLYLAAIMPRICHKPDMSILHTDYYAHRGFHDNHSEAPENSMAAFRKAVDAGYGIELDVQLTKDRIPVVFHDETLKRVCGIDGNVRDYAYEELQKFSLCGSKERIPLFKEFLEMVDGKVPLVVEIKIHENAAAVCSTVDALLKEYQGPYCIESFDPRALAWYKKNRPEVMRGQLSSCFRENGKESLTKILVHYMLLNFLGRPDFIAYDHRHHTNLSRRICCNVFGALSVCWTIKSSEELKNAGKHFKKFIFEGFDIHQ